jgi:hypothetical protein
MNNLATALSSLIVEIFGPLDLFRHMTHKRLLTRELDEAVESISHNETPVFSFLIGLAGFPLNTEILLRHSSPKPTDQDH